ncbi:MAG: hypothetical protein IT580_21805 [Verrucomicrobiales bacterium]|nr:hypothetical protein [Verrucomicrobiales bacterium]
MFLIERFPAETPGDVQEFLDSLLGEVYGSRPEWVAYELRDSYRFQGRDFTEMFSPAGSVYLRLAVRASTGNGISRDILQLGTRASLSRAWLIHHGQESEYGSDEVQKVG